MEIQFARSATKHRISRQRSLYVVKRCEIWLELGAGHPSGDPRFLCLGADESGAPMEVVVVVPEPEVGVIIHAMALREKNRLLYEVVTKWEK